jgi:hypothetical protein
MPISIATSPGWLIFVVLLALPAAAQTLYKSTMPDGRVIYGDKPAQDAAKVEETRPDISKGGIGGSTPREAAALNQLEKGRQQREMKDDRVSNAEKAVRSAEAARDAGKEPLPGERIGTAGGASRLTDAYWQRQKNLEENVEKARRSLEQAPSNK